MNQCASCGQKLEAHWKFCVRCGRPFVAVDEPLSLSDDFDSPEIEPVKGRYDGPFWVGVGMGVIGLALIIYAAIQIYGSQI